MIVAELAAVLGLKVDKKSWSVGNDLISGLGKALAVWAGYKLVDGLKDVVAGVLETGDALNNSRQKVGISAESLQELTFAAEQSGASMDSVLAGAKGLAKGLAEFQKTGKGKAVEGLTGLGISLQTVKDKMNGPGGFDDVLGLVAEKISAMPDGISKTVAAQKVFGKAGGDLIPLLNEGAAGLDKFRARAHELGLVMSNEDVQHLDDFGDQLNELGNAWKGIKQQAVIALLPVMKDLATRALAFITANRAVITGKLTSAIGTLADVMSMLGTAVAFALDNWQELAALFVAGAVVTGIIRLIKFVEWLQLASTAAAAQTTLAWAAAAAPFVLLGLMIAGVILAFTKYRKQTKEFFDEVRARVDKFPAIIKAMLAALSIFFAPIIAFFTILWKWIGKMQEGKSVFRALGEAIKETFQEAFDWVRKKAGELWDYIKSLPGKAKDALLGDDISETGDVAYDMTQRAFGAEAAQQMNGGKVPNQVNAPVTVQSMTIQLPKDADPDTYGKAVKDGLGRALRDAHADVGGQDNE